jgi:hypothetical protein
MLIYISCLGFYGMLRSLQNSATLTNIKKRLGVFFSSEALGLARLRRTDLLKQLINGTNYRFRRQRKGMVTARVDRL